MTEAIATFYKDTLPLTTWYINRRVFGSKDKVMANQRTEAISRDHFALGAGLALCFLIGKIAAAGICLVAYTFSCCSRQSDKQSFCKHLQAIPTYAGAAVVGLVGAFFPQTINKSVLGIS